MSNSARTTAQREQTIHGVTGHLNPLTPNVMTRLCGEVYELLARSEKHWWRHINRPEGPRDAEEAFDQQQAEWCMRKAWLLLMTAVEMSGLSRLTSEAQSCFDRMSAEPLEDEVGPYEPFLTHQNEASRLLGVLEVFFPQAPERNGSKRTLSLVRRILRNAGRLMTDRDVYGWAPCKEEDIHERAEGILRGAYPDLTTKPPLGRKVIKDFTPDTGISELSLLVEYKFVRSKQQAAKVVDEIHADLSGYSASDYENLIFCIYEAVPCFAPSKWQGEVDRRKHPSAHVIHWAGVSPSPEDMKRRSEAKRNDDSPKAGSKAATPLA